MLEIQQYKSTKNKNHLRKRTWEKKERIRVERYIVTIRDQTALVEMMVTVHQGWEKPTKHIFWWVYIIVRLGGNAQIPPLQSFTLDDVIP